MSPLRFPLRVVALASALVAGVACAQATTADPAAPSGARVYVAIQGAAQVAVVDATTHELLETVDLQSLGFSPNAKPHHIAVEPDGSHWYLSLIGENRVLKFDRDNRLVDRAEFEVPGMLAVHPTEDVLYVGRSMSAVNPPQRIGAMRRSDMSVEEVEVFFPRPHALTVHPTGAFVYSGSLGVNQLGAVDTDSWDMELTTLDGPTYALVQFAVSPDGSTLVATSELTARALVFDLADPARPSLRATVEVGRQPWHPVFAPDSRHVYFGNKADNTITVLDAREGRVVATIEGEGLDHPHGSALSPDGRWLFVSNNGPGGMDMGAMDMPADEAHAGHEGPSTGTLVVVDTSTREIVRVITLGENATGVGASTR